MTKARLKTKTKAQPARVVLVDDHPIVRHGLAQLIDHEPDLLVCGDAASPCEAIKQIKTTRPDVVVIDISLKDGDGLDLIKEINAQDDNVKMLVTSMHDETLFAERALRAGAMGYVNKHEAVDKIVGALRRVLQDKIYLSETMANRLLSRTIRHRKDRIYSPVETLTDRELEVFRLIGRGLTTQQIADKLCLSVKTVETYRYRTKTKLRHTSSSELTVHAAQWILRQE